MRSVIVLGCLGILCWITLYGPCRGWSLEDIGFDRWLSAFREEALSRGISSETLDDAFKDVTPIPRVIELDRNQPEVKLSLKAYLSVMVSDARVARGREAMRTHRLLLKKVSSRYGVQSRILVALWGIESDFGRLTGGFPVIEALATLAYDGRRSDFFRRELFKALGILDGGHIPVAQMEGSWAGAMGQMQFMPSTFHGFAVDFNENGRTDIWTEREDIFASAANYLARSGWKRGQLWGREVKLPSGFARSSIGLEIQRPIGEWQVAGVRRLNGNELPSADFPASIVQPDGEKGRAFMVYNNYRVLLKWNRSHNFALSVGLLSDRLLGG